MPTVLRLLLTYLLPLSSVSNLPCRLYLLFVFCLNPLSPPHHLFTGQLFSQLTSNTSYLTFLLLTPPPATFRSLPVLFNLPLFFRFRSVFYSPHHLYTLNQIFLNLFSNLPNLLFLLYNLPTFIPVAFLRLMIS